MLKSFRLSFFAYHVKKFVKIMRSFVKKWLRLDPFSFEVVVFPVLRWSCCRSLVVTMKKTATQARRSQRRTTPGRYVCGNPFHSDWGSPAGAAKDSTTRKSLLEVFSAIAGRPVNSVCRPCRAAADEKPEIYKHQLYSGPGLRSHESKNSGCLPESSPPHEVEMSMSPIETTDGFECLQCAEKEEELEKMRKAMYEYENEIMELKKKVVELSEKSVEQVVLSSKGRVELIEKI